MPTPRPNLRPYPCDACGKEFAYVQGRPAIRGLCCSYECVQAHNVRGVVLSLLDVLASARWRKVTIEPRRHFGLEDAYLGEDLPPGHFGYGMLEWPCGCRAQAFGHRPEDHPPTQYPPRSLYNKPCRACIVASPEVDLICTSQSGGNPYPVKRRLLDRDVPWGYGFRYPNGDHFASNWDSSG